MHKEIPMSSMDTLTAPFTRRKLLTGAVATSVIFAASKYDIPTPTTCPDSGCSPLEISDGYREEIETTLAPIRNLIAPEMKNFKVNVLQSNKNTPDGDTYSNSSDNPHINIYLPDTKTDTLELGLQIANHEATHMFDGTNDHSPATFIRDELTQRMERGLYTPSELALFTESEYSDDPLWDNMGHPNDGYYEVFASTTTILRFYPDAFIGKIEALEDAEKSFVTTSGLVCVEALKKFSAVPIEYEQLPFQGDVIDYLQTFGTHQ